MRQLVFQKCQLYFNWKNLESEFDKILKEKWKYLSDQKILKYSINKHLNFKHRSIVGMQFIIFALSERFTNRRKPLVFTKLMEPICELSFNFTKANANETMFTVKFEGLMPEGHVLGNISPLMFGHSLLVPNLYEKHNQVLRQNFLQLALSCILVSTDRSLCLGFNSLLAYATVNHLHFHLWYSPQPLHSAICPLTNIQTLNGYQQLLYHPIDNFVFEFLNKEQFMETFMRLWNLIEVCQSMNVAHNLFAGRTKEGIMRVVLWIRRSVYEQKSIESLADHIDARGYNVAVAELAGMMVAASDDIVSYLLEDNNLYAVLCNEKLSIECIREFHTVLLNQQTSRCTDVV